MNSFDSSPVFSPSEGAEPYRPKETIVGFTSVYLSRGHSKGYGLYFSKTRIFGVRKRRASFTFDLALTVPLAAVLLYLELVLRFSGPSYAVFLLLFLPVILDQAIRRLRQAVPERITRKNNPTTSSELGSRIDFEHRREEIAELLLRHFVGGRLSPMDGSFRITLKSHPGRPIEIRIHGMKQFQTLREIVIEFAARQPQVRALEY